MCSTPCCCGEWCSGIVFNAVPCMGIKSAGSGRCILNTCDDNGTVSSGSNLRCTSGFGRWGCPVPKFAGPAPAVNSSEHTMDTCVSLRRSADIVVLPWHSLLCSLEFSCDQFEYEHLAYTPTTQAVLSKCCAARTIDAWYAHSSEAFSENRNEYGSHPEEALNPSGYTCILDKCLAPSCGAA